jgi:S1-C subfamily serine protease
MEDLNGTQIILLTLLLSFVTSIATGIVTTALLSQAPQSVTQTINRVVEKTVERVVPTAPQVITKEVKTIVREESLVSDSVEANTKSLVRIKVLAEDGVTYSLIGIGFVVNADGTLIVDKDIAGYGANLRATFSDGKSYELEHVKGNTESRFTLLHPIGKDVPKNFISIQFADSDSVRLGQSVIALNGNSSSEFVGLGIVSNLTSKLLGDTSTSTARIRTGIESNIRDSSAGGLLMTLQGNVIGLYTKLDETSAKNFYIPSNLLKNLLVPTVPATTTPAN